MSRPPRMYRIIPDDDSKRAPCWNPAQITRNQREITDVQCTRIDDVSAEPEEVHPSKERKEPSTDGTRCTLGRQEQKRHHRHHRISHRPSGIRERSGTTTVELHRRQQGDASTPSKTGQAVRYVSCTTLASTAAITPVAIAVGTSLRPEALDGRWILASALTGLQIIKPQR